MAIQVEIRNLERRLKEIFHKEKITQDDVNKSNKFMSRWKELTGHTERTECPILIDEHYIMSNLT